MLPRDLITRDVRRLVEKHFLESVSDRAKVEYAGAGYAVRTATLKAFLQGKADGTKYWSRTLQDLL